MWGWIKSNRAWGFLARSKGQLFVESAVAITILLVGLTGLFTLTTQALGLSKVAADRYIATHLAAEGIELVKLVMDSNLLKRLDNPSQSWTENLSNGVYEADIVDVTGDPPFISVSGQLEFLVYDNDSHAYVYERNAGDNFTPTRFTREIELETRDGSVCSTACSIAIKSKVRWRGRGGIDEEIFLEAQYFNYLAP